MKYSDVNGLRFIQTVGLTTWNDGECIFGPIRPYEVFSFFYWNIYPYPREQQYRSMLVHFERGGEVLYDVWPKKEAIEVEPVTFTKDQMATIILPTEPDASKGKYYRLDRFEKRQIVFEEELQPRAHVPYIIVPSEDFSIDPGTLDLEGCRPDTASIEGISFIGTYISEVLPSLGGDGEGSLYYDIIDTTPDCGFTSSGETETFLVGALRAYLEVDWDKLTWDDPIDHGGSRVPGEKLGIVLLDHATDINEVESGTSKAESLIYNLAGQRISKPTKGIYIENGQKRVR